jgi:hypothetical protein
MIKDLFDNNHEKKNSTHCNKFAGEFFERGEYEEAEKYFQLAIDLGKEATKENPNHKNQQPGTSISNANVQTNNNKERKRA